ncbi:MAG: hypothetical protein GXC73_20385, partial [Chitinophagaceae bacterium]|nr:hypothetical protein [Chitinophagaceae bacterium]
MMLLFCVNAQAQNDSSKIIVSIEAKDMPAIEFLKSIEQKTGYRFYFDVKQIDTVVVTAAAVNQSLQDILNMALAKFSFYSAIDKESKSVF